MRCESRSVGSQYASSYVHVAHGVLLPRSDLLSEVASLHEDSGVGFSVSVAVWGTEYLGYLTNIQDLNLPISLLACVSVLFLLDLPTPPGSYREKIMRMDWMYV